MDLFELAILALIQGLTEFLPISSSAHLILPSKLLGWNDQGLTYDVAVHFGTLVAVVSYYRKTLFAMAKDICLNPRQAVAFPPKQSESPSTTAGDNIRLFQQVVLASIPVLAVGFFFHHWIEENLRSLLVIAFATIFFGVLLGFAEIYGRKKLPLKALTFRFAFIIGIAQALALIPGTSRSGITITAAMILGMKPSASAHFSFLLSIPTILAATVLQVIALVNQPEAFILTDLIFAGLISGVSAYITIALFIKLLGFAGMLPFVYYRLALGFILLFIIA